MLRNKTVVKVPTSTSLHQQNISRLECLCTCAHFSSLTQMTEFLKFRTRAYH